MTVTGAGAPNLTPAPSYSGSCSAATLTVAQGTSCTASYTFAGDANHSRGSSSATITITKASTSGADCQTVTPSSQQYSDKVDLSATVVSAPPIGGSLSFYINYGTGTQQLLGTVAVAANSAGTVTGAALLETVAGSMNPAAYVVTAGFTPSDLNDFTGSANTASLTITQEDARATYSGARSSSRPQARRRRPRTCAADRDDPQDITAVTGDPLTIPILRYPECGGPLRQSRRR